MRNDQRPDWFDAAACKNMTELFFPPGTHEKHDRRVRREAKARAICNECPSLHACRRWAREHHEIGVWGGETDEQRIRAGYALAVGGDVTRRAKTG